MAETVTHTLEVPGGTLVYDVLGPLPPADGQRPLFMIGHPMGSSGFAELASYFPERTVVSYDPRGCERSQVADADHSPRQNAEDVHQLIGLVGGGPVDVFGSSGGAVTGLALVAQYPDDVGVLVAHEPPILGVLPDADNARAAFRKVAEAYHKGGFGAGMAQFIALTSTEGEFTPAHLDQPAPNPAMFGLPTQDDGGRDDVLLSGISDPMIEYRTGTGSARNWCGSSLSRSGPRRPSRATASSSRQSSWSGARPLLPETAERSGWRPPPLASGRWEESAPR